MKDKIVMTRNVVNAEQAVQSLLQRNTMREEGMGLFYGKPGEGKSTTTGWLTNRFNAVFLRANGTWTVTSMLRALSEELNLMPQFWRSSMISSITEELAIEPRPIFVDEADYLIRRTEMLDVLRDVYDMVKVPTILITMEDGPRALKSNRKQSRFVRRITHWVEFKPLSEEDTHQVVRELADVEIEADLVKRIHAETAGNIGHTVIAIGKIERLASTSGLGRVGIKEYGTRRLTDRHA